MLATETGWPATTVAKLLHEHNRPDGPEPAGHLAAGTTVVLDEASMASSEDLDALAGLVERHRWRLVCVGDPAQLPALGRGGMFALWCERLAAHRLEEVRRFADDWQATASLALRRGEPAAARAYATHHRLQSVHPALVADRVSRQFERLSAGGRPWPSPPHRWERPGPSTSPSTTGATLVGWATGPSWPTTRSRAWGTGWPLGETLPLSPTRGSRLWRPLA